MLLLEDLQVVLGDLELVDAVLLDRVALRAQGIQVREVVAELVRPGLREPFAALARHRGAVIARAPGFERREDLVQGVLADAFLAFGAHRQPSRRALDLARALEQLLEIRDAESLVEESVLLAELLHPAQRLLDVAPGLDQQAAVDLHQLLEELDVLGPRALPLRVVETHRNPARLACTIRSYCLHLERRDP